MEFVPVEEHRLPMYMWRTIFPNQRSTNHTPGSPREILYYPTFSPGALRVHSPSRSSHSPTTKGEERPEPEHEPFDWFTHGDEWVQLEADEPRMGRRDLQRTSAESAREGKLKAGAGASISNVLVVFPIGVVGLVDWCVESWNQTNGAHIPVFSASLGLQRSTLNLPIAERIVVGE
ncbi:hypothetical protein PM082_001510 [Marasmius tenuissimus]|nr:hypothetical protein PM082_001510 [Marasmius tenuissimus]